MIRYLILAFALSGVMATVWTIATGERFRGPQEDPIAKENDEEVRERVMLARQRLAHPETGCTNAPTRGPRRRAHIGAAPVLGHLDRTSNIAPQTGRTQ